MTDRIAGCLIGAALGDIIGAPVEGESRGYLRKRFRGIDDIVALEWVPEILGGRWIVGHFTDDTRMSLDVAQWLLDDPSWSGEKLLEIFADNYQPARRYGSGTARILQLFPEHRQEWRSLATSMFPGGSFGNGSAMRVAPVGCLFARHPELLFRVARTSSLTTHSHPLAVQGAVLQAAAVAAALRDQDLLPALYRTCDTLEQAGLPPTEYRSALQKIETFLAAQRDPLEVAEELGCGIAAIESLPQAWYCYLSNRDSYARTLMAAIFGGGDVDTIASMAGAISGAALGIDGIPRAWLAKILDPEASPARLIQLARQLEERALGLPPLWARLTLGRSFSADEYGKLQAGHRSQDMDDKWNIDFEDGELLFRRSWTGVCIYRLRFGALDEGGQVRLEEAWACRDAEVYRETDDGYDALLLSFLMDNILLGRSTPFPIRSEHGAPPGAYQHHVSGTGYPEKRYPPGK